MPSTKAFIILPSLLTKNWRSVGLCGNLSHRLRVYSRFVNVNIRDKRHAEEEAIRMRDQM